MSASNYSKLLVILLFVSCIHAQQLVEFVVVIPSYNNQRWCKANLDSVIHQRYENFEVMYINDCSTDQTGDLVDSYVKKYNIGNKIKVIHNQKRAGALKNLYNTIHTIPDHKVVVLVDGDDKLAHSMVLDRLAKEYSTESTWLTYGQYVSRPLKTESFCKAYPEDIIQKNAFRAHEWSASHPRTFYAGLFKKIKKEDFLWKHKFYPMAWDLAIMFPMLEMASKGHFSFIADTLYIYNDNNPRNDHKIDASLVLKLGADIRAKQPYAPLDTLACVGNRES